MASVKGINETIKELRKFGKDAEILIDAETEAIAFQIENDAKNLAPKNFGKLAQSISNSKVKMSNYKVTVNEKYGAYMEFGTGKKFKPHIDKDFNDMAKTFKGKKTGTFEQGLESIKAWCRAKGIDEKDAKWTFLKILGAGINPQPFLYPSWIKGKKDYLNNLSKLVKQFNKKI